MYTKTPAREGYAPLVWKQAQIQGLRDSRSTIRGEENFGVGLYMKQLYKVVEGPNVLSIITRSYFRRRMR